MPHLRIISRANGVGLARDLVLLGQALAPLPDARVEQVGMPSGRGPCLRREAALWAGTAAHGRAELQVFSERVYRRCLPLARHNVLVPNPEWFLERWLPLLPRFDRVLCKTRHAQRIFDSLGCETRYIGFTSVDRLLPMSQRRRAFFHLAGRSSTKGTETLLDTWLAHPHWPTLTVVQHPKTARRRVTAANIDHRVEYLEDETLRYLQNSHLFHVCPSETEGFGHYLMEAMSCGAITLATGAAPMDELVGPGRGLLIPVSGVRELRLAQAWQVSPEAIAATVEAALSLPEDRLQAISRQARRFYLDQQPAFHARLKGALGELLRPRTGVQVLQRG